MITAAYLAVGVLALAAWQFTGNIGWAVGFFGVPAAALMVWLALTELWLSVLVFRQFAPDDLLRPGWLLIACSAGCQVVGMLGSQVLGAHSRFNPLTGVPGSDTLIPLARNVGLLAGGTLRFALLAGGLYVALQAYRRSRLQGRLALWNWAVLAVFAVYLARNVVDVVTAERAGKSPDVWELLGWPVDPLLWVLLLEALLLLGSARQMDGGRISLCWKAFSAGVFLTALGDIGLWATNYGYLPWPWSSLTWYVWLPAAAAFARAPAFQLEVMRDAADDLGSLSSSRNLAEP